MISVSITWFWAAQFINMLIIRILRKMARSEHRANFRFFLNR